METKSTGSCSTIKRYDAALKAFTVANKNKDETALKLFKPMAIFSTSEAVY